MLLQNSSSNILKTCATKNAKPNIDSFQNSTTATPLKQQFFKTKICPWYFKGRCDRGETCQFAHSFQEVRTTPDLFRTSICPNVKKYGCCCNSNCKYAHAVGELRATGEIFKTALCVKWMMGSCTAGNACRHAHGNKELRIIPTEDCPEPSVLQGEVFKNQNTTMSPQTVEHNKFNIDNKIFNKYKNISKSNGNSPQCRNNLYTDQINSSGDNIFDKAIYDSMMSKMSPTTSLQYRRASSVTSTVETINSSRASDSNLCSSNTSNVCRKDTQFTMPCEIPNPPRNSCMYQDDQLKQPLISDYNNYDTSNNSYIWVFNEGNTHNQIINSQSNQIKIPHIPSYPSEQSNISNLSLFSNDFLNCISDFNSKIIDNNSNHPINSHCSILFDGPNLWNGKNLLI